MRARISLPSGAVFELEARGTEIRRLSKVKGVQVERLPDRSEPLSQEWFYRDLNNPPRTKA